MDGSGGREGWSGREGNNRGYYAKFRSNSLIKGIGVDADGKNAQRTIYKGRNKLGVTDSGRDAEESERLVRTEPPVLAFGRFSVFRLGKLLSMSFPSLN